MDCSPAVAAGPRDPKRDKTTTSVVIGFLSRPLPCMASGEVIRSARALGHLTNWARFEGEVLY